MLIKHRWEYYGTLNKLHPCDKIGVYLIVHGGNVNRIIYVGTTVNGNKRLNEHRIGTLNGKRTIWRVGSVENHDIYNLMSHEHMDQSGLMYKYYYRLAKNGKLWATTTIEKDDVINDLNKKDNFAKKWKQYVEDEYINKLHIWFCEISDPEKRIILESQIQRAFKANYRIGSHIHKKGMCWLGKIEATGPIFHYKFWFSNYPNINDEGQYLLANLSDKRIISYKKDKKHQKTGGRKVRGGGASGNQWEAKEDQIIYTCYKLGISHEEISEKYLTWRNSSQIKKRIKHIIKFYGIKE